MISGGILIVLIIPGFLLTKLIWKKLTSVETICLAFGFSIVIDTLIILLLGMTRFNYNITGGITVANVWFLSMLVSCILLGAYLYKYIRKKINA